MRFVFVIQKKISAMSAELFRNQYRIASARASWHDYNGGAYFITICTKNREHYFGEITHTPIVETWHATSLHDRIKFECQIAQTQHTISVPTPNFNPFMHLSEIGEYTTQCVENITQHNPYANVPLFVVMPNHVHLIVLIDDFGNDCRDAACHVSTKDDTWRKKMPVKNIDMQNIANCQGRLSTAIGNFKSAVTKYANAHRIPFAWQPRFHDRIIRTQDEMNRIAEYVENNVSRWQYDKFFD